MKEYHRLLRRQVKKSGLNPETCEQLSAFLHQINEAYTSFDNDLLHIEGVLEKSSQELYKANKKLQSNVDSLSNELTRIANNIQEVIFEVDLDGYWSYLNPTWKQMTGLEVQDCLGKPFLKFVKQSTGLPLVELIQIMNSKLETVNESFGCMMATGEKKWLNLTMKAIQDRDGNHKGFIGSIRDNTDLKNTEKALIEAKNKALKASSAKDDFLSTMSHEIRTPLNAVIGMSHLLLLEDPKPSQLKNLNALKYSSEHLLGLVNDILDFNKIASESLELEDIDFNISYVLSGLNSIFTNRAKEKGIRFIVKKDSNLPDMVMGDSTRFTQILTNLIGNAIKFTEKGKVVLDIELANETEEYLELDFAITDTGIGIKKDKIDKIFESFTQADADTTRKYGGTGLGLAICKKLIEIMGSELHLESCLGKGSTFYFTLSMKKSAIEVTNELNRNSQWIEDNEKDLKGARILVAEDNKVNILVLKQFLNKWNVDYDIALNGLEALEKATNKNYDLVLMDLQMPEMNGFEATKAIRESDNPLNKIIPIYALSASTGIDIRNQLSDYGLNGLLTKPFDPNELYQTITDLVYGSDEITTIE